MPFGLAGCRRALALAGLAATTALLMPVPVTAAGSRVQAALAERFGGVPLAPSRSLALADTSLTCFTGPLSLILNPGCFSPPASGDCATTTSHFFVQDLVPSFSAPHRVLGFGFISNDGATVWPSAGVVVVPFADNRFPTTQELAGLQVRNVPTPGDTAVVIVDLRPHNVIVSSDVDVYVCLQFPTGQLQTNVVGTGPGILVDQVAPDPNCDFLTVNGGGQYFRPAENDPLDWGFELVLEPVTAVEGTSWAKLKSMYGQPRIFPYRRP